MSSIDKTQFNRFDTGKWNFEAGAIATGDNIDFEVGESGGSISQQLNNKRARRGLVHEQQDPLAIWWVKLLKAEYSADGTTHRSYRRSRWGHPACKRVSPISPFFDMHKEGRLLASPLFAFSAALVGTFIGLVASLNMVAMAEPAVSSSCRNAAEIPSAERFSMMKDFVGQHNQFLDLSKLNEFKWADETRVAAGAAHEKRHIMRVSTQDGGVSDAQPQAVQAKKHRQIKNDAELTGQLNSSAHERESGSDTGSRSFSEDQAESQSQDRTILDSQTN